MSEKKTTKKQSLQKVKLVENIKLNENRYKKGDEIEVSGEELEILTKAKVIAAGIDD